MSPAELAGGHRARLVVATPPCRLQFRVQQGSSCQILSYERSEYKRLDQERVAQQ